VNLLFALMVIVWVFSVIDVLTTDAAEVRSLPKWAWIAIVVVGFVVGAVAWLLVGRPARPGPGGGRPDARARRERGAAPARPAPRPSAPRRVRRAEHAEEVTDIEARIAERDRLLARWAEEDRAKRDDTGAGDVDGPV